jgi:hypothetical protein
MWGGLATLASALAGLVGWQADPAALTELMVSAGALVGGGLTLWGRMQASQPIRRQ